MRVGIITFHCAYNFGSALQAYALQQAVESLGHTCRIVDYRSRDFNSYKLIKIRRPMGMLRSIMRYRINKTRKLAFEAFWKNYLNLTERTFTYKDEQELESLRDQFDCFVCGSDQIWNLDCTKGVVGPFFLSFAGDRKRVAYAPSLAHTAFEERYFDRSLVSKYLSSFDYLSVREEETIGVFQPLVSQKIEHVLDPTLLLRRDAYEEIASVSPQDEPFIFAYMIAHNPLLVDSIRDTASRKGKRVLYVASKELHIAGATNVFGIGPSEFMTLLSHADCVLTNSFHATVFSILFHKPFWVFSSGHSSTRILGLLKDIGLRDRFADFLEVGSYQGATIDWLDIEARLELLRKDSWDYLRKALS